MKRTLIVLFTLLVLGALAAPVQAVDPITVTSNTFANNFRQDIQFALQAQSSAGTINQVALFIQINGATSVARQIPVFTPGQQVQATYTWRLTTDYLPPGVTGQFWWTLEDDAGSKLTTDKQSFRVEDSSKPWKQLSNEKFALYWYNGGDAFGQALFECGVQAMEYLQQDIGITVDTQIQTFVYGDRLSFMDALRTGAQEWTGGVAFSDYSIILINAEPSRLEWGKGATTHELTHQVIAQKIRSPLGRLSMPAWINEGLAEYYEAYPAAVAPQSREPLRRAIQNDTVPALRTLSGIFPADSAAADLAYAQSYSAVDFIYRRYGKDKMAALLQEFKKGGESDSIFVRVLGLDVDALDNEWRKDVGLKPRVLPTRASGQPTPFPTFSLSTDDPTPVPPPTAVLTPTPFPTATSSVTAARLPSATPNPSPPLSDFEYGAQVNWTAMDHDTEMSQLAQLGFKWAKIQVRWCDVEPTRGAVDLSRMSAFVSVAQGHNIRVLASVVCAPAWSRESGGAGGSIAPDNQRDAAAFMGGLAKAFCGRGLSAIEVWESQNTGTTSAKMIPPPIYMDMLRQSYAAISANCPSILVVSGGLAPSGVTNDRIMDDLRYFGQLYQHGLKDLPVAIGAHPPGYCNAPDAILGSPNVCNGLLNSHRAFFFKETLEQYHRIMQENGDSGKLIWPTMVAWGSNPSPQRGYDYLKFITPALQAQWHVQAYQQMKAWGWIGVAFVWNLDFTDTLSETSVFHILGQPAFEALKSMSK